MPVQMDTSILNLNQEEVTAVAHREQSVSAVGDPVLPEPKTELAKESPEPTQEELSMRTSQEAEVPTPSLVANTTWIRTSRGVTQLDRQSSEFAPEIEGTDCVFVNGGTAVAPAQPEDPELSIGRPIAFRSPTAPPPRPNRLQPLSTRPCIRGTDCFLTISARERQIGPTRHSPR